MDTTKTLDARTLAKQIETFSGASTADNAGEDSSQDAYIRNAKERFYISVRSGGYGSKGRVQVSGYYLPKTAQFQVYTRTGETWPSFTMSEERAVQPELFKREVERRLLVPLRVMAAKFAEQEDGETTAREAQAVAAQALAKAVGGEHREPGQYNSRAAHTAHKFGDNGWLTMSPNYDGKECNLEIHSVSHEVALKIAALLKAEGV